MVSVHCSFQTAVACVAPLQISHVVAMHILPHLFTKHSFFQGAFLPRCWCNTSFLPRCWCNIHFCQGAGATNHFCQGAGATYISTKVLVSKLCQIIMIKATHNHSQILRMPKGGHTYIFVLRLSAHLFLVPSLVVSGSLKRW